MHKYKKQMLVEGIGVDGQTKLKKSCVAIVGVGAIGSLAADYLARAGIGKIILIDKDKVEEMNIHRQLLYSEKDLGKDKVDVAERELLGANNSVVVAVHKEFLSDKNAKDFLEGVDVVLDCADNMLARKVIADFCAENKKIWIHAAASGTKCNVLVIDEPSEYERYFGTGPLGDCSENAILGPAAGIAACVQATEAIKIIVGAAYCKELQRFDLWKNTSEMIKIKKK
jgi:molybdopterin/thiamine biosynthesis adenylyltransferase